MGITDKDSNIFIEMLGFVFVLVGAGKWLYDIIILDNYIRWKVYLIMIIVGVLMAGYMKLGKALISIKLGRW